MMATPARKMDGGHLSKLVDLVRQSTLKKVMEMSSKRGVWARPMMLLKHKLSGKTWSQVFACYHFLISTKHVHVSTAEADGNVISFALVFGHRPN